MVLTFIKMAGGHEEKVDFKFISGIGGTSESQRKINFQFGILHN